MLHSLGVSASCSYSLQGDATERKVLEHCQEGLSLGSSAHRLQPVCFIDYLQRLMHEPFNYSK